MYFLFFSRYQQQTVACAVFPMHACPGVLQEVASANLVLRTIQRGLLLRTDA